MASYAELEQRVRELKREEASLSAQLESVRARLGAACLALRQAARDQEKQSQCAARKRQRGKRSSSSSSSSSSSDSKEPSEVQPAAASKSAPSAEVEPAAVADSALSAEVRPAAVADSALSADGVVEAPSGKRKYVRLPPRPDGHCLRCWYELHGKAGGPAHNRKDEVFCHRYSK